MKKSLRLTFPLGNNSTEILPKFSRVFIIKFSFSNGIDDMESNMALMEVAMPSGYIVDRDTLNKLMKNLEMIKRTEAKNANTVAVIYFDHIGKEKLEFSLCGMQAIKVKKLKPASITVYDYYDSCKHINIVLFLKAKNEIILRFFLFSTSHSVIVFIGIRMIFKNQNFCFQLMK